MTDKATNASTVTRYLAFWNSAPGAEQRRVAEDVFTDNVRYRAPIGAYDGPAELMKISRQFAEHLGVLEFRARTEPEFHHDRARLQWEILRDHESFATGTEVLTFADDGRITDVAAFLDKAPEGFDPHAHDEQAPS